MISTVASLFKMSSFDKKLKACKETIKYILHTHTHNGGGGPHVAIYTIPEEAQTLNLTRIRLKIIYFKYVKTTKGEYENNVSTKLTILIYKKYFLKKIK